MSSALSFVAQTYAPNLTISNGKKVWSNWSRCLIPECESPDAEFKELIIKEPDLYCKKPVPEQPVYDEDEDSLNCSELFFYAKNFESCKTGEDIFLYDLLSADSTLVTEFDLVCEER